VREGKFGIWRIPLKISVISTEGKTVQEKNHFQPPRPMQFEIQRQLAFLHRLFVRVIDERVCVEAQLIEAEMTCAGADTTNLSRQEKALRNVLLRIFERIDDLREHGSMRSIAL
jgi:hypothetical protein